MKHILLIVILIAACITQANAADGRRTNAILGFAAGAVTGWMVHDAMPTQPVINHEVYVAPQERRSERSTRHHFDRHEPQIRTVVIERVVVVEPPVKRYVVIDGKAYELVEAKND